MSAAQGLGPLMVDLAGCALSQQEREVLAHPLVGGVILFSRNYRDHAQLAALTAAIRSVEPELLIAVDYEGGRVQRFRDGFTRLPPMAGVGALFDRDAEAGLAAAQAVGWLIGDELSAFDIDLPLAPVLDLAYGPSAVIGDRAFHRDPDIVAALATAVRDGLAGHGMAATGKHYPGHGGVAADSHAELPVDGRSEAALAADAAPYAALIRAGLESVMMAHIRYPAVDAAPASLSPLWIGAHLRGALGFEGAVFCDDLSMGGAAVAGDYPARARAALAAGCDILPVCNNPGAVAALLAALAPQADDGGVSARRRAGLRRKACTASKDVAVRTEQRAKQKTNALARIAGIQTSGA